MVALVVSRHLCEYVPRGCVKRIQRPLLSLAPASGGCSHHLRCGSALSDL